MSRPVAAFAVLCAAAAMLFAAALSLGDQPIPFATLLRVLGGDPEAPAAAQMIVTQLRLPRALLAFLAGAALGTAGAIAQTVMRNPLAEPGLLGINGGAALAALVVIVSVGLGNVSAHVLPVSAFSGALLMAGAIYLLAWRGGTSSARLILIGIGLNALAGAGAGFISVFGDVVAVQHAQVWLAGSVHDARWAKVAVLAAWLVPGLGVAWLAARDLDLLALGDGVARGLGQRAGLVAGLLICLCALLAGAAVAAAGPIAFVGLIAPHAARHMAGTAHGARLPVAALAGGIVLLAADLAGRVAIAPAQLPAGLVCALIGAPFFGWVLWRRQYGRT